MATQFQSMKSLIEKEAKKTSKLESKLQVLSQGYLKRYQSLASTIQSSFETLKASQLELGMLVG